MCLTLVSSASRCSRDMVHSAMVAASDRVRVVGDINHVESIAPVIAMPNKTTKTKLGAR